ncbi:MAG: HlyD family type I secretion periplasmic adaptor subunit [Hyphomicrobiales bacterium]|nr:HlyD family type I secretion periplasmic adaptor subunit [Hyphomicrobiales bacterium]
MKETGSDDRQREMGFGDRATALLGATAALTRRAKSRIGEVMAGFTKGTSVDTAGVPEESSDSDTQGGSLVATTLEALDVKQRKLTVFGFTVVGVFFGGLAAWSALAPLETSVLAEGQIVVAGNRNLVQSERGGVVREILSRDGDRVEQGQVLIRLDGTRVSATYQELLGRYYESHALHARLIAERDGLETISIPDELSSELMEDPLEGQKRVFEARQQTLSNRVGILKKKEEQLRKEISALETQIVSDEEQLSLLSQEAEAIAELVEKQLTSRSRFLALRRAISNLTGEVGANKARIARAEQAILSAELEAADLKNRRLDSVVQEISEVAARLGDIEERLRAGRHDLESTELRAPKTGTVVGTTVHTLGGVVSPGEILMEIVPEQANLIVDARVRPKDIEQVQVDLPASVRLTGFNMRVVPTVEGKVTYVSADSLLDRRTNTSYYLAKIAVNLAAKPDTADLKLQPGMPASVMVVTGTRTVVDYLLSPITDSVSRAMTEK